MASPPPNPSTKIDAEKFNRCVRNWWQSQLHCLHRLLIHIASFCRFRTTKRYIYTNTFFCLFECHLAPYTAHTLTLRFCLPPFRFFSQAYNENTLHRSTSTYRILGWFPTTVRPVVYQPCHAHTWHYDWCEGDCVARLTDPDMTPAPLCLPHLYFLLLHK